MKHRLFFSKKIHIFGAIYLIVKPLKWNSMKKTNEDFISSLEVVDSVFDKYQSVWSVNTVFTRYVDEFKGLKQQIDKTAQAAKIVTTGATKDKSEAATEAFSLASKLSKRVSVYALEQNNMEMHNQLRVSKGSLSQLADTDASKKLHDIYDRMLAVGSALDPFVTPDELATFKTLIEAYDKLISRPRELIVDRKVQNESLPQHLQSIRKVLYKLDSLISFFDGSEFEAAYRNARIIVNTGGRTKA